MTIKFVVRENQAPTIQLAIEPMSELSSLYTVNQFIQFFTIGYLLCNTISIFYFQFCVIQEMSHQGDEKNALAAQHFSLGGNNI